MYGVNVIEFNTDVNMEIGQRIQTKRIERGLSGAELGVYLNVSANQVSRIETGKATCKIENLFMICQLLDCSADYLLFGIETINNITSYQKACLDALISSFK